jgi:hypothetical protein
MPVLEHLRADWLPLAVSAFLLACAPDSVSDSPDPTAMREALTFYASFDETLDADLARGQKSLRTRFGALDNPSGFRFEDGYPKDAFRVAPDRGVHGGALEATDVLPENGRIFFPAERNLPYDTRGWGGTVSFWLKTNPDTMLKTPFCDPVQITEKGATDGGLWIDFPDSNPRDLRLGAFQSEGNGRERIPESDPDAPLVVVSPVGFEERDWRHLLFTWSNFDSGAENAQAVLYIDGKPQGAIGGRSITMDWNLGRTGIYVAVNYIGLLDEFAIFDRPLNEEEIARLATDPAALAGASLQN